MKDNILKKIEEWEEECEFNGDYMYDSIRDFFSDTLSKGDLFTIIERIKSYENKNTRLGGGI